MAKILWTVNVVTLLIFNPNKADTMHEVVY